METFSITFYIINMATRSKKAQEKLQKVKLEAQEQIKRLNESAERRAKELQHQIEEAEEMAKKAIEEEKQLIEETERKIKDMCTENGFFCGVIITKEILLQLVNMAIDNKGENIKIPFRLYHDMDEPVRDKKAKTEEEAKEPEEQEEPVEEEDEKPKKENNLKT
jgi:hypothetical protein